MHLILIPNTKGLDGLAAIDDVKGYGVAAVHQIGSVTQGDFIDHGQALTSQAFSSSH
jgi:hypothetical protein